jgi:hypothetical protein
MRMERNGPLAVLVGGALMFASAATGQQESPRPAGGGTMLEASGQTVTPVFEGWFTNPDGTVSLSFGYYSRNREEIVDIPLGPDNFVEPRQFDGRQPTHFLPQPRDRGPGRGLRYWSVFTITVPADYEGEVSWTLRNRGETFAIPGHRRLPNYEMDALRVDASGSTPPFLRLEQNGKVGFGPGGVEIGPLRATVGQPLRLDVWSTDDTDPPVALRWFHHQGPGRVTFDVEEPVPQGAEGHATTLATFSAPGEYMLRVRATNDATEFDRYCCWTNGYVRVTVAPR